MRIKIMQLGKTKDEYLAQGLAEYLKRLKAFAEVEVVELKEEKAAKSVTREQILEREGAKILDKLKEDDFLVALDEGGREMNSMEFAKFLGKHKDRGREVVFVIGGAFGLSEAVKQRADLKLAMSRMTFTHQMVRLILLEQIYRGLSILAGKEYHI